MAIFHPNLEDWPLIKQKLQPEKIIELEFDSNLGFSDFEWLMKCTQLQNLKIYQTPADPNQTDRLAQNLNFLTKLTVCTVYNRLVSM